MPDISRTAAFAAGAVALVAIAGCGGGSSTTATNTPTAVSHPTMTVTKTTETQPAPSTATTSASPANIGPTNCVDGSMAISAGQGGAATGNYAVPLLFKNISSSACYLRGWPGVTPYVHAERGTPAKRETTSFFGNGSVKAILVQPGVIVSALVAGSDNPVGGKKSCPTYTSLKVTPPNFYKSQTIDVTIPACARLSVLPVTTGTKGAHQPS